MIRILFALLLIASAVMADSTVVRISAPTDDAHWRTPGTYFTTTWGQPYLGKASGYSYDHLLRFQNIDVYRGATIDSAFLVFDARVYDASTTVSCVIWGEDTANASTASNLTDYQSRAVTTASVSWPNLGTWTSSTEYVSPDIKTVIAEITSRADWVSGNALMLFVKDDNSTDGARRNFESYDGASTEAVYLRIYWAGAGAQANPGKRVVVRK